MAVQTYPISRLSLANLGKIWFVLGEGVCQSIFKDNLETGEDTLLTYILIENLLIEISRSTFSLSETPNKAKIGKDMQKWANGLRDTHRSGAGVGIGMLTGKGTT